MRTANAVLAAAITVAAFPTRAAAQGVPLDSRAWRASHVALASAFTAALWIDAAQTREALRRGYEEANPILGRHPTNGKLSTYTVLANVTVLGAAAAVPARLRSWVLGVALAVETLTIARAARAGVAITFP